jgi:pimeloyl-ACP methyl ester carboxylesterase
MSPLFILPGLLCNLSMFSATMEAFPGATGIDDFYGRETSLSAMAEYALARAPERFVLLGHSMGARIALEIMRRAPERVEALVLADTGIHPIQPKEREKRYALRDIGREQGFAALVDAWLPPMLTPAALADTALVADLRAMCISLGRRVSKSRSRLCWPGPRWKTCCRPSPAPRSPSSASWIAGVQWFSMSRSRR